ncbi:MAG TPA: MoxR family ATPase [Longimicrobiales bacterium]|nr:MoxR family ATPase [Longimicrobiales bacterium]
MIRHDASGVVGGVPGYGDERLADVDLTLLSRLVAGVETVFHGKREVVRLAAAALLARGHVLFEDIPGVGKTTLARALAASLGLDFRRIQFTSDLLPSDVLGVSLYNPRSGEFETRPGPLFTNVVLADEINRAPPRTQSGLLEAMQEGRVTIDERTYPLPHPFMVMATQNPLEQHGTYPLPESQLDRFLLRLTIGYPDGGNEREILLQSAGAGDPIDGLAPVLTPEQVESLQAQVDAVRAEPDVVDYLMSMVQTTRTDARLRMGVSPRGAIALFRAARAYALMDGRRYLTPDDVRTMAPPCLAHRLLPAGASVATSEAHDEARSILEDIVEDTPIPV